MSGDTVFVDTAQRQLDSLRDRVDVLRVALVDSKPADGSLTLVIANLLQALLSDIAQLHQSIGSTRSQIEYSRSQWTAELNTEKKAREQLERDMNVWRDRARERAEKIEELKGDFTGLLNRAAAVKLTPPQQRSRAGRHLTETLNYWAARAERTGNTQ